MRQLTSLDAQFLAVEDGRTHGHVSAVAILDPSTTPSGALTLEDITRVFRERLHLLPPLRWRLVEVPLGLDHPYWLDDPDFDLEFHLRELHLPPPGTLEQLADQVNITVFSYQDRVDFGVVADRELMPDLTGLVDALEAALAELLTQVPGDRGRGTNGKSPRARKQSSGAGRKEGS